VNDEFKTILKVMVWSDWGTVMEFAWMEWKQETSVSVADDLAQIWNRCLLWLCWWSIRFLIYFHGSELSCL